MNNPRRIQRHLVKALAAGAVLVAAALPLAISGVASAATAPTLTGAFVTGSNLAGTTTITDTAGSPTISLTDSAVATFAAGDLVAVGNTVIGTLASPVTTVAATATTATLVAGASTTEAAQTVFIYAPIKFGEGDTSTTPISVLGTGFAADGGNVSLASGDADLTFTTVSESSSTQLLATVGTKASTTFGSESLTATDDNGVSNALAGAITVDADPTVTAIAPTTLAASQQVLVTATGTFAAALATPGTVALTNTANGTSLEILPVAGAYTQASAGTPSATQGEVTSASATSLTFYVTATNDVSLAPATPGTYALTVTNTDGGPVTTAGIFTVTAAGITNVSPSAFAISTTAQPLTINGYGFQPNATVALSGGACASAAIVPSTTTVVSPNVITFQATSTTTVGQCTVTVQNPVAGNDALFTATDALGVGEAGVANATVTAAATTPAGAIVAGSTTSTPVTLAITGTGFSTYSTVEVLAGTGSTAATGVTATPCVSSINGDTLTCTVAVSTGATAGVDGIAVASSTGNSGAFEGAITVAGPTITSSAPAALAVGAPEGTVITLTGTGFNGTATAVLTGSGLVPSDYVFAETSPTTATITLTAPLPQGSNSIAVVVTETIATGITVSTSPFTIAVDAHPVVSLLVNTATNVDGVGAGANNASVTITGTGFKTGATIGKFVSVYGVADTAAAGTVVSVNTAGTQLVADITLPAADANISDGYTITNTDGGTATVAAFTTAAINIDGGPTITAVSPTTATADSTAAFTITGTGFVTGASVSANQPNGTCGAATVVSPTSITVSCTFLAAGTSATSLVVTNPDGGSATSAVVLAATTTTTKPAGLSVTAVHGTAIAGKTVTLTISGTGFYGQPKITSTATGTKAVVTKDSGKLLTVRVTSKAGVVGEHTFTIKLANGKSAKKNYDIKK